MDNGGSKTDHKTVIKLSARTFVVHIFAAHINNLLAVILCEKVQID